jgi:hypothetical protein
MSKSTRDSSDSPIVTDPYSVPVGQMAPHNPPFIVKRSNELPAGQKGFRSHDTRKRKDKGEDSQVDTTHDMPELYQSNCRENQIIEHFGIRRTVSKTRRTGGLCAQNGTVKVDHPNRQSIMWIHAEVYLGCSRPSAYGRSYIHFTVQGMLPLE